MILYATIFTVAALAIAPSHAAQSRQVLEDGIFAVTSSKWTQRQRCASVHSVHVMVMMRKMPEQLAALEESFWAVSDPDHERYGQHLSNDEVTRLVGATDEAIKAVSAWLWNGGATRVRPVEMKDVIEASIPCPQAETLFGTRIHVFEHSIRHNVSLLRAVAPYSVPSTVANLVSMVGDLNSLPEIREPKVVSATEFETTAPATFPTNLQCGAHCGQGRFVTPGVLTEAYKLGSRPTTAKGSMAVAEFQGVMWDPQDLAKFCTNCDLTPPINVSGQIGKNEPAKCRVPIVGSGLCAEAMLDIEYIGAIGGAIPLTDVYNEDYSLLKWAQQIMDLPNATRPLVHSVSYGNDEIQQTSKTFMLECNTQFMKFGALGMSVLFASGDQGVQGRSGAGKVYHPDFPGSSPYITTVGGTDFATAGVIGPEKAWTQGGGGFSNTFPIPLYQEQVVQDYFKTAAGNLPEASKWNNTGRGYPDVSALGGEGNPYCVVVGSLPSGVAGTSAACPVVAAVFAKLNEVRLAKGGAPLGFLNPFIYKNAAGFNDVTQGRNCGEARCDGTDGFPAVPGWDASTGFGTPNFEALSALV